MKLRKVLFLPFIVICCCSFVIGGDFEDAGIGSGNDFYTISRYTISSIEYKKILIGEATHPFKCKVKSTYKVDNVRVLFTIYDEGMTQVSYLESPLLSIYTTYVDINESPKIPTSINTFFIKMQIYCGGYKTNIFLKKLNRVEQMPHYDLKTKKTVSFIDYGLIIRDKAIITLSQYYDFSSINLDKLTHLKYGKIPIDLINYKFSCSENPNDGKYDNGYEYAAFGIGRNSTVSMSTACDVIGVYYEYFYLASNYNESIGLNIGKLQNDKYLDKIYNSMYKYYHSSFTKVDDIYLRFSSKEYYKILPCEIYFSTNGENVGFKMEFTIYFSEQNYDEKDVIYGIEGNFYPDDDNANSIYEINP